MSQQTYNESHSLKLNGASIKGLQEDAISTITNQDLDRIWSWNANLPETADVCVHDLIVATARKQPDAVAISAWDGEFTYRELDNLSTRLCHSVIDLCHNVTGGTVALVFEKSKWMPVSQLAVMKAGAAGLAIDPTQPKDRLMTIMSQIKPVAVLSSKLHQKTANKLASWVLDCSTLVVDDEYFARRAYTDNNRPFPRTSPSDALYIVFTSGSTGVPKGVTITHSNFSSAIYHQQSVHNITRHSRVFDFSSYTFDVSWGTFLQSLTAGACLCIPSDADRKDDLAGAIDRLHCDVVEITPSAARLLPLDNIAKLSTLILTGERLRREDAERWASVVKAKNFYGPCECTVTSTTVELEEGIKYHDSIGRGRGANTWITDLETGELVPIGSTGELLLEGPIVGPGYFNDSVRNAEAFIENPPWLLRGAPGFPGRSGRMYRTGDLVCYENDGSVRFIGRKDSQVKINGQRVELSEIENKMGLYQSFRQFACLIPAAGPYADRLVGIFSLEDVIETDFDEQSIGLLPDKYRTVARDHIEKLKEFLQGVLPSYMIPLAFIVVRNIPLNMSAKLDYKVVRAWLSNMDEQTYRKISGIKVDCRQPNSNEESLLRDFVAQLLDLRADRIDLDQSFITNGGDSLSAMRLSAQCRATFKTFSISGLLKNDSLGNFAKSLSVSRAVPGEQKAEIDAPFNLSPIQRWFFENVPETRLEGKDTYCNQGFYLKFRRPVASGKISHAISRVVDRHPMLRARYKKSDLGWMQRISNTDHSVYHFATTQVRDLPHIEQIASDSHRMLDIENGPVFSADLCILPSAEQCLVLIASHLVVDLVSWRIMLDDFETLLEHDMQHNDGLSYQSWIELQIEQIRSLEPNFSKALSTRGVNNNLTFWGFTEATPNSLRQHDTQAIEIDQETTAKLLGEANRAFNSEPVDILLSTVWDAFFRTFQDRSGLSIFSEGHGRESWSDAIELFNTVGWFTTMSPIHVSKNATASGVDVVRVVKDSKRGLAVNGWAYFASRYLSEEGNKQFLEHGSMMEVVFNYHGQFQQLEQEDSLFEPLRLNNVSDNGRDLPAGSIFNIEASIQGGKAFFEFSYNRKASHQDLIQKWIAQIKPSLQSICEQLVLSQGSKTLCDYEFVSLDYMALDELQHQIIPNIESVCKAEVEEVLTCTPMVNGILLSQMTQPHLYRTSETFEIKSNPIQELNLDHLVEAWQLVVQRHPSLRCTFIEGIGSTSAFSQVILRSYRASVTCFSAEDRSKALEKLEGLDLAQFTKYAVPHRLTLCQSSRCGTIFCRFEMSHAITDGWSTVILAQDWSKAYAGLLEPGNLIETSRSLARSLLSDSPSIKMRYWSDKLAGAEPCHFPRLTTNADLGSGKSKAVLKLSSTTLNRVQEFCRSQSVTLASLFLSAWSLTLAAYVGTDTVCFGYLGAGRDLEVPGIEKSIGAFFNLLIMRATHTRSMPAKNFVKQTYNQVLEDLGNQHCSLAQIQHNLGLGSEQSLFNSIVSIQSKEDVVQSPERKGFALAALSEEDPTEFDIFLGMLINASNVEVYLRHDRGRISEEQARRVLSLFTAVIEKLVQREGLVTLNEVDTTSTEDQQQVWHWNHSVPKQSERSVHDVIVEVAKKQPSSPAICAWDGDLTYSELNAHSTRLAQHLVLLGVGVGSIVPLLFEKSRWTPVAMLAVMKAGGASVVLDPNLPKERLRTVVLQIQSTVVLSSMDHHGLASEVSGCRGNNALVVNETYLKRLSYIEMELPEVSPTDTVYICFTSGSTGVPKGVVITHSNINSAIKHQQQLLGFTTHSRIFDFASYMFDVVWCNLLQGLQAGSCICIPSAEDRRNDIMGSMEKSSANVAIFTPSTVRGLDFGRVPSLEKLHFIGEALSVDDIEQIPRNIFVTNIYGPTECTTFSTYQAVNSCKTGDIPIGRGAGLNCWIVQPLDHEKLAPIGTIGELLLEGPLVAAGYHNDFDKTSAAFIVNPSWLTRGTNATQGRHGRLYRTGDLVRYNGNDCSLTFIGRKDAQIKINGQRVELGDIEHCLRANITDSLDVQVAVEMATPENASSPSLVAFLAVSGMLTNVETSGPRGNTHVQGLISELRQRLVSQLPSYMIPSTFMAVEKLPMTVTGKIDRQQLRRNIAKLTSTQLVALSSSRTEVIQPETPMEHQLQALWSRVLGITTSDISIDDSFLKIGGDSVRAMRLVGAARKNGLSITVVDIFKHPRLRDLAKLVEEVVTDKEQNISPFSLIKSGQSSEKVQHDAAALCGLDIAQIEDVLPCTPLQEGMLALTAKSSDAYVAREVLQLQEGIDIHHFRSAWEEVLSTTPILRTRIIDLNEHGLVQVVTLQRLQWQSGDAAGLTTSLPLGNATPMGLGTDLLHFSLVEEMGQPFFILTIHHALYDGWSMALILDKLDKVYHREVQQASTPFNVFVKHIGNINGKLAADYWQKQLEGMSAPIFPALPSSTYEPQPTKSIVHNITELSWPKSNFTASSIIRAAWAILTTQYTNTNDTCFGVTITGRQAAVEGAEQIMGPTIATVPVRVQVDGYKTVEQLLEQIQTQATEMISFEQMGIQRISKLGSDGKAACRFQTLLVIQPHDHKKGESRLFVSNRHDAQFDEDNRLAEFDSYAMSLEFHLAPDGLKIRTNFDDVVVSKTQVQRFSHQFELLLRQLCVPDGMNKKLVHLDTINQPDLERIWAWNAIVPETVDKCVHDIIAETSSKQPEKVAVCAWDGSFTYGELERFSSRLAIGLNALQHESISYSSDKCEVVPLLFEKSKWMAVSALAVMKAGRACLGLDMNQPKDRLQAILDQVNPIVVLCSADNRALAEEIAGCHIIMVDQSCFAQQDLVEHAMTLPIVHPSSPLYLIFTSGSTGTPKGVMITHSNFASAIQHSQQEHGFKPHSRVYDFASYAFDVAWSNLLHTLAIGACLCVPSDTERKNDLVQSIVKFEATHLDVTPSIASTLPRSTFKQLETLVLGGEALQEGYAKSWASLVTVKNPYGPSECTITSTLSTIDPNTNFVGSIGKGLGLNTWIVDPSMNNRLMPIGAIGELMLEGPLVGPGYYGKPEHTKAVFVKNPAWLLSGDTITSTTDTRRGRTGRLYMTGDLVRYDEDGDLIFVGRKDAQVKINGQRVELGDVEHHVRINLEYDEDVQVAAEVIRPKGGAKAMLVAFFNISVQNSSESEVLDRMTAKLDERLATQVPAYMIPSMYIPLSSLPMTATGKIDRRQLRQIGEKVVLQERNKQTRRQQKLPSTPMEIRLQVLWASILAIDANTIGADDHFLRIGGDSIAAMRLVKAAREKGMLLTVANVLRQPKLSDMARTIKTTDSTTKQSQPRYEPFSLVHNTTRDDIIQACKQYYHISENEIYDIMPVTDQQARFITMTYSISNSLLLYHTLDFDGAPDMNAIQRACSTMVSKFDILRTVFVPHLDKFMQVTLKQFDIDIHTFKTEDKSLDRQTEELREHDIKSGVGFGAPLTKFSVIHQMREQKTRLVVRMSHAQHDGISVAKMWNAIEEQLDGQPCSVNTALSSFSQHMSSLHLADRLAARSYWRELLASSRMTEIRSRQFLSTSRGIANCVSIVIPGTSLPQGEFTFSTIMKAAWALVLARSSGRNDVVFGALTHGRNHLGQQEAFGACVSVLPVRVSLLDGWNVRDLIKAVSKQQICSMQYENVGPREIVRECTDWPKWMFFGSVLHHQNFDNEQRGARVRSMHNEAPEIALGTLDDVQVHITSLPDTDGGMKIVLSFAANTVSDVLAHQLIQELVATIIEFHQAPDAIIAPLQPIGGQSTLLPIPADQPQIRDIPEQLGMPEIREALGVAWTNVFDSTGADEAKDKSKTFFDLGGDLVAAGVVSAHLQKLGFNLSADDILDNPTWQGQLQVLGKQYRQPDVIRPSRAEETRELLRGVEDLLISFIARAEEPTNVVPGANTVPLPSESIVNSKQNLVTECSPEELVMRLRLEFPESGAGKDGLLDILPRILQNSVNTWHQGFMHKLFATTNPIGVISELILAVLNTSVSPALTVIEKTTAQKLAAEFGLVGRFAGGNTYPGGSACNLAAMVIARNTLFPDVRTKGHLGRRFVAFTSVDCHYSISKAAEICSIGMENVWSVPTDDSGCMRVDVLRQLINEARVKGLHPFFVNATAGTTVRGAYDPLLAIADICEEYGLWMHVDASWGGAAAFSTRHRHKLIGTSRARSVTFSPHKMLGVPVTCSFLLGADMRVVWHANRVNAGYLFHDSAKAAEAELSWDMADSTLQCGRRGDSLKLALSWMYYGRAGLAGHIDRAFDSALSLARLVAAQPELDLVSPLPPPCLQVCFYYRSRDTLIDSDAARTSRTIYICDMLVQRGLMIDHAPGPRGLMIRAVVNGQTSEETIQSIVQNIVEVGSQV